ncbi:hypothetical protein [Gorillibacterium massiliense]|uniref:hypothetical protein n=1 Tax=Gorillibacterium massiliense TaxID=1280390 RepID=UPI00059385B1|nr:hypothetical protein [Gorillibacterium massiliense]
MIREYLGKGIVMVLLLAACAACSNRTEKSAQPSASTPPLTSTHTVTATSTLEPSSNLAQPTSAKRAVSSEPVQLTQASLSSSENKFAKYFGYWIDAECNLRNQDTLEDSINIYETFSGVNIYFYLTGIVRITDSSALIRFDGENSGVFEYQEEGLGKGTGTIIFDEDQVRVRLQLKEGSNKTLTKAFHGERVFVRDPYKDLTYYDPILLIKEKFGIIDEADIEVSKGVSDNEEGLGRILKIVQVRDENGVVQRRFLVNTLNGYVKEWYDYIDPVAILNAKFGGVEGLVLEIGPGSADYEQVITARDAEGEAKRTFLINLRDKSAVELPRTGEGTK